MTFFTVNQRDNYVSYRTIVTRMLLNGVFFLAFFAIIVCIGTTLSQAQTLNIATKTSTIQIKTADIDSATVQTTTLTFIKKDKTTQVIAIADIQRMTFTNLTGVADAQQTTILGALALIKAYPNPTNTTTVIEYELSRPAAVEAQIMDATGKLVKTVVTELLQAGTHQVQWDAKNQAGALVASGTYTCIIRTGNETLAQKLIIIH